MIQLLATRYNKRIASLLLIIFECSFLPAFGKLPEKGYPVHTRFFKQGKIIHTANVISANKPVIKKSENKTPKKTVGISIPDSGFIGGPSQPEMSSFKSVGTDNMVNLFTGDFSYNIPLLDVGGYPVNIFYDGSITMEQEASWVGLGWNINPGTVNRNMRGVPDDFDGTDLLKQTQLMKPNITWGFSAGYDLELVGIKDLANIVSGSVGASLDLSFNNYLGPAFGIGVKGTTNIKIAEIAGSEKSSASIKIGGGISANVNSRSGVTLSPNVSLTANASKVGSESGFGTALRLGTSYNSRSGIKQLQLSEQVSYNYETAKKINPDTYTTNSESLGATSTSSISFSKPSYIPALRMPLSNEAYSGHFQLGNALFGVYGSAEVEAYKQISRVAQSYQEKPLVGYLYYQNAVNNPNAVMDFTRFNDNEVTPNTPIISAPQYSYDVFSIQGEGTGGTIRAYRDDLGYVRDNTTRSQDKSFSGGVDVGIPGHYGANFNIIKTPTVISEWDKGNKLRSTTGFVPSNKLKESVYFRNPGETSVLNSNQLSRIGGTDLVRFKLGGTNATPTIEPFLEQFSKVNNTVTGTTDIRTLPAYERKKRTQVTSFLTADEASKIGLDKTIKNYNSTTVLSATNNLEFEDIGRVSEYRKAHHISQINVTEANGRRYIYGIPVYNITQKDFTFSVDGTSTPEDQIGFSAGNETTGSSLLLPGAKAVDGFVQITETPAYAHSFLLTGLLSPDYVDVTGNGITEDDLGDAVKFNYTRYNDHQWRTPLSAQDNIANFNDGNRSEKKDDKGIVSYGKRESWYLHSIESKTMIALFTLEDRKDGKGVPGEQNAVNVNDNSQKRLKKIDLYSKSDLKKNGLTGTKPAKPIKTVWFTYSYSLCANTPGNNHADEIVNGVNVNSAKGKLTLDGIYFTFNGKNRTNKNKYVFSYTNSDGSGNPAYALNASDRWGNYKPIGNNPTLPAPEVLKNSDYPYSVQNKTIADQNAGAWSLKKILLPSGGQVEVEYESDDYAFVQNRRAATMMRIVGIGKDQTDINSHNLYRYENEWKDNFYVFIEVPDANVDIKKTYLEGLDQLAFKLAVNMPKGMEYINCYASIDGENYGKVTNNNTTIWVKLKPARDGVSPLTLSVLDYLRERLPGQAFRGYDVSESTGLKQIAEILGGMGDALKGAFKDPIMFLRSQSKAQTIIPARSFVRLNNADGHKYGGGQRVKSVVLKDNWQVMTGQYTSKYGQKYDYTTTEVFNGVERSISSGVASYEPSIGSEENPFQSIIEVSTKLPLGPASYGAIEMPVLDAFFPAPLVGYSKVTVRSIQQGAIVAGKKSRSGIGKQVTEFYTAKDFPVYYNHTSFDPSSDKTYHDASLLNFFYKYAIDTRALSQGFIVETNDMHGKLKSQSSYAEGDEKTRINYTENFYRNTGSNGLNEKFDFIYASRGGEIEEGNMGVDVELMTDTREFSVKSTSYEVQGQVDLFPVVLPFWLAFIWPVSGNSENTYRAVTTTKAITYHGIVDRVVVIDKGSMVTTKNLVYDAETGDVVVSQTQNEFDKPVYNVNYPAYWAYSGMGLAYKNIDAVYSGVNFLDGKIVSGMTAEEIKTGFESGDELYIITPGSSAGCDPVMASPGDNGLIWALDKNKNITSLTDINPDFIFIDNTGKPYSRSGVKFRIVRSGKRNMLNAPVAGVTMMTNPVNPTTHKLIFNTNSKVINASAVEYKEKWQTDNDVIYRYRLDDANTGGNLIINGDFSQGNTGFTTQYIYHPSSFSTTNPYYSIATTSNGWFPSAANCNQDHTSGNGNMMLVDGAIDNGRIVWSQTIPVTAGTSYLLSAWAMDINQNFNSNATQLRFKINGSQVGLIFGLGSVYPCTWFKFFSSWNSGNSTSAVIEITSSDLHADGNDFALDDISFAVEQCALPQVEVPDCSGYLEKKINPYQKGLVGNFRGYRNMVFYGDRVETNPTSSTNLVQNGFLDGFNTYWNFNSDNNLVPDINNAKWVWNTQSTRFNSKGMELETKDALNIYTAAQYGFQKTLPTAITNNSRYEEMMYEGFEDHDYAETLNDAAYNPCAKKHIDFTGVANSQIVNTDNSGVAAHSGKYMLGVNAGGIATKSIPVNSAPDEPFSIDYQTNQISQLNETGGNFSVMSESGTTYSSSNSFTNFGSHVQTQFNTPYPSSFISYAYRTQQYFEIQNAGTYSFFTSSYRVSDFSNVGPGTLNWTITSVATGVSIPYTIVWSSSSTYIFFQTRAQICLPKGIYLLECTYSGAQYNNCSSCSSANTNDIYDIYIENNVNNITSYKSLSTQNTCTYTRPAAASGAMINPTFNVPPGKKMLFSAWVKDNCTTNGGNACLNSNQVDIVFNNGGAQNITIKPSGPVIEGWQRYEGYFNTPGDATQMDLKLVNNSNGMIYFDDIRIHPFNANMKSYVYDPVNLRLKAELDANNYASFYEYDEEGALIRTKAETKQGIKTITETRSFKQAAINQLQ